MTVASPFYAARIPGTPDVPVSMRTDAGSVTLDVARAPHVEGDVLLSMPTPDLLDDLDPRDNRRLVIDVYPDSHMEPVYSAWTEQRRNLVSNPSFEGDTAGWAAYHLGTSASISRVTSEKRVGNAALKVIAGTAAGTYAGATFNVPSLPAGTYTLSAWVKLETAWANGIQARAIYPGGQTFGALRTVVGDWGRVEWTYTSTSAGLHQLYFCSYAQAPASGSIFYLDGVLLEASPTVGPYFDGSTNPNGELERTRWLGTPDASASVVETRTVIGQMQVPDGDPRSFDLGIREVNPDRAASTVQVRLASDEAMLGDFSPLDDDHGAWPLQSSVRAVCDYVLGKIGAALEPGSDDADVTAFWEVTNLLRNPAVVTNLNNWSAGGGVSLSYVSAGSSGEVGVTMTSPTGAVFAVDTAKYNIPATPGELYTFSVAHRYVSGGGSGSVVLRFLDNNNQTIVDVESAGYQMTAAYTRVEVSAVAPPSAAKVAPFWRVSGGQGRTYRLDQGLLHTSPFPVPPFTGGDADTSFYTYEFEGPSNDSASIRKPVVERDPEALVWRAGVSGLDFLRPLLLAAGLRLVCDEQRRWTLRGVGYRASGAQSFRDGVNIVTADEDITRDEDQWFDGCVVHYSWTDREGKQRERYDSFALTPTPTKVIRREVNAPYPGPGRAEYAVRRAQGTGRTITATKRATWGEHAEQEFSALLEGAPMQLGTAERVVFDLAADTVTTTSRTVDTPAAAWLLIPHGEAWLDSPVGESWTEEIING